MLQEDLKNYKMTHLRHCVSAGEPLNEEVCSYPALRSEWPDLDLNTGNDLSCRYYLYFDILHANIFEGDQHAHSWLLSHRSKWSDLNFDIRNGLVSQNFPYFDIISTQDDQHATT